MQEEPHVALPRLYGLPAYARSRRVGSEQTRPFDPDELPLAVEMTDEERVVALTDVVRYDRGEPAGSASYGAEAAADSVEPQPGSGPSRRCPLLEHLARPPDTPHDVAMVRGKMHLVHDRRLVSRFADR